MVRFSRLSFRLLVVGLTTKAPFIKPTRTPAIGLKNGIGEQYRAADAPLMLMMSGSFSLSAERTSAMTCVS